MTLMVNKVEIEVQKQTAKNTTNQWMTILKYESKETSSTEILSIVLSNSQPIVKHTIDNGKFVKEK